MDVEIYVMLELMKFDIYIYIMLICNLLCIKLKLQLTNHCSPLDQKKIQIIDKHLN